VQSQQLLPKGEVLQEEFSSGAKGGDSVPSRHVFNELATTVKPTSKAKRPSIVGGTTQSAKDA
jgi:hypothetical protein